MTAKLVRHWMTPDPITISASLNLSVAYNLMRLNEVRHMPVVDDDDKLVGILTWGDIREARPKASGSAQPGATWESHFLAAIREVRDFMTPNPLSVTPDAPIQEAARQMLKYKFGGLPVVEDERVIGIITESDLFRFIVESESQQEESPLEAEAAL